MAIETKTIAEVPAIDALAADDEMLVRDTSKGESARVTMQELADFVGGGGDASTWSQYPATQDVDLDGHKITGLPSPTDAADAATKGYVDARPGADAWSEHAATEDVDMDGHKITGLGAPSAASDAATKGYVDAQAGPSDRITGGAGTTYDETQLGVGPDATGDFSRLLRGVNRGDVFINQLAREHSSGTGHIGWRDTRSGYDHGYVEWSTDHALLYGGVSGRYGRVRVDGLNGGNVYLDIPGAAAGGGYELSKGIRLGSHINHTPNIRALPSNVNSILHGIKLGVDAHDTLASMPAPPDLEWWDPVWTPLSNVDSVSNVECQYTRTYRAAGGSLVTLEGTITVEIDEDDAFTNLAAPLPVPATSTGTLLAPVIVVDSSSGVQVVCTAGVTDLGSGPVLVIEAGPLEGATGVPATLTIGFRISYRAA